MDLYVNEYFTISEEDGLVYLKVSQPGFDLKALPSITDRLPRLKVTAYGALSKALQEADNTAVVVGAYRPELELEISKDEMHAYVKIYMTPEEREANRDQLGTKILELLVDNGIRHGIKTEVVKGNLSGENRIHVAEGIPAEHGDDAVIVYYKPTEKTPTLRTDGSVNHYELNLIDPVRKGDWLGEKTPATEGKPGISVNGTPLSPKNGRDKLLKYDPKTVEEVEEDGKTVLRAKIDGAFQFREGRVSVDNHMVITGNVDFSTGNIDFDGYVTVNGTIEDSFSVTATQDITINGDMGVGAVEKIESRKGSVLIKGGINGKGVAKVFAHKNIYVKFSNETHLEAGNQINVGLYALDSYLKAGKILVNPLVGKVIGGEIHAEHQVVTASIGNSFEKQTVVNVKGFERLSIKEEMDRILLQYRELVKEADAIRRQLEIFEANLKKLDDRAFETFKMLSKQYEGILDEALRLNGRIEELQEILKTRGEGEVKIHQAAYPKTMLEIKNMQTRVREMTMGSFYAKDKGLHFDSN